MGGGGGEGYVCIIKDLDNLSSDNRGCTAFMTNPSEEGKDSPMVTLIEGLIDRGDIQEKQKIGENLIFLNI